MLIDAKQKSRNGLWQEDPRLGRTPGREQDEPEPGGRGGRRKRGSCKAHRLLQIGCRARGRLVIRPPGPVAAAHSRRPPDVSCPDRHAGSGRGATGISLPGDRVVQDAFQNAPRRLTRRCISPAAANAAPYATRSPTSRSRPPPVIAATASIPAARRPTPLPGGSVTRARPANRYRGGSGRAARSFCRTVARRIRRHRGANRRGPRRLARRPGSLPRAGQHGTGSAPSWHHIDAAAPSFPGNAPPIAEADALWGKKRASPAGLALSSCHIRTPWRAVHLWAYCTTCASLPERTGRRSRSAAGP